MFHIICLLLVFWHVNHHAAKRGICQLHCTFCVACVQALVQPKKLIGSTRRVWPSVLVSWLLAAIVAVPQSIVHVQTEERRSAPDMKQQIIVHTCHPAGYTAEWQRQVYLTFMTLSLYVIPACVMIYCYSRIVRAVWLSWCRMG